MPEKAILFIGSDTAQRSRPRAFEQVLVGDALRRVQNVSEALDHLQELQAGQNNHSLPALVLLCSSVESGERSRLISWMRSRKPFERIPIVVLTSIADDSCAAERSEPSRFHLIRIGDTETLLDLVSKYLPEHFHRASVRSSST